VIGSLWGFGRVGFFYCLVEVAQVVRPNQEPVKSELTKCFVMYDQKCRNEFPMPLPPTDPEIQLNSPGPPEPVSKSQLLTVCSFGMTDRGLVRATNEDQFLIARLTKTLDIQQSSLPQANVRYADDKGHIFVVADGLGGEPVGEEASALAVTSIEDFLVNTLKWFFQLKGPEKDNVLAEFQAALRQADANIFKEVAEHPNLDGMGTTLTLAYSLGAELFVANAGDSRCYRFRSGLLWQMTHDHSLVQDLVREGLVPLTQVDQFDRRLAHVVTNTIGGHTRGVNADVHKATLEPGDVLLLATDGLTNFVPDERIAATLRNEPDPQIACERLVAQAIEQGGRDNVTVIVARYEPLKDKGAASCSSSE
jgi:serine/threonine protein phosphatase PrpC